MVHDNLGKADSHSACQTID